MREEKYTINKASLVENAEKNQLLQICILWISVSIFSFCKKCVWIIAIYSDEQAETFIKQFCNKDKLTSET